MERVIFFPKNEFKIFNDAKKYFNESNYKKAINLFQKAIKLKYLKAECIKYIIDCHIELHNYEEVYKMIEDEFVLQNINEEYLLKKYLYTMVLDGQYIEANEIIHIYKQNKVVSNELMHYLDELLIIINKKLNDINNKYDDSMFKYLTSSKFDDQIQIILNLESLNYQKYEKEVSAYLKNAENDSFIKYSLLKYLIDNKMIKNIYYTNYFNEKYLINDKTFINLLEDERYLLPINRVLGNVEHEYPIASEFLKNIWLDFCVKHYPKLIENINISSGVLHVLLLKSLNITFNINDICKIYKINSKSIFQYFEC